MQLPVQGKFDEAPGWALRPAYGRSGGGGGRPEWGQQYGRSQTAAALRPDSPWSRQNRSPQWGRQRMPEVRGYLRGLGGMIPPAPSDASDPQRDLALKSQWVNTYYAQSRQYADAVVAALQSAGFTVNILGSSCDPGAGCVGLFQYQATLSKDGKSMDASIGNPVRYNSPQEEASDIASLFSIYAVPAQSYSTGINTSVLVQPSSTSTQVQLPQEFASATTTATTAAQTANAAATTSDAAATTTTYRRDVQLLAPDGYKTGGRFTLKIWGLPNQTVEIEAWQNGQSHGRTAYGATDSSGYYEISGSWQPEHAGRWQENIYVGGEIVGRLDFELANPSEPPGNVTVTPTMPELPAANQPPQPGSGGKTTPDAGGQTPGVTPSGSGLPMLLLIGGAAVLLFAMSGGGKK
jgi:hypothetical protein